MDKKEFLNITRDQLNELLKHEIAHGTDGTVYRYDNKYLLKLYHSKIKRYKTSSNISLTNDEDIKIFDKSTFKPTKFEELFNYYESDDIKLRNEDCLKKAISIGHKIIYTRLPQKAVYIDGNFVGCLLIAQKGLQIHSLIGLPLKLKKKILFKVLRNVKELLDNNIYHCDLDNSPYSNKSIYSNNGIVERVGHSHVLVNPITLEPSIIDLEGKSTTYTNFYSKKLEEKSLTTLTRLIMEFMLKIDLDEYEEYDDELCSLLESIGVSFDYIDKLVSYNMNYDELCDFVGNYKGR